MKGEKKLIAMSFLNQTLELKVEKEENWSCHTGIAKKIIPYCWQKKLKRILCKFELKLPLLFFILKAFFAYRMIACEQLMIKEYTLSSAVYGSNIPSVFISPTKINWFLDGLIVITCIHHICSMEVVWMRFFREMLSKFWSFF